VCKGHHVFVQIFGDDVIAEAIGIREQQATIKSVFGHHGVVVKFLHVNFRQLQNGKTGIDGFIHFNLGSKTVDHGQIFVDDFEVFESRRSNQFLDLDFVIA